MTAEELAQMRATVSEAVQDCRQRNGNRWAGGEVALNQAIREEAAKHQQTGILVPNAPSDREAAARLGQMLRTGQQSVAPLIQQSPAVIRDEYAVRPQVATAFQAPAGHSPSRPFTRSDILAILRGKQAECRSPRRVGQTPNGLLVLAELVDTFENLE